VSQDCAEYNRDDGADEIPQDAEELEEQFNENVSESVRERLRAQRPDKETRAALLKSHVHHLVRTTESAHTVDRDTPEGIEIDATAHVEDTYCFTCGEWVGVSGVDLRGTPRSKADAHYLGGPPDDVREAREEIQDRLGDLAEHALLTVEHVETAADAFEFVGEQLEKVTDRAAKVADE